MRSVAELMSELEDVVDQLLEKLEPRDSDDDVQRKVLQEAINKLKAMNRPVPETMAQLHAELESKANREEVPLAEIREHLQKLLSRTKKNATPPPPAGGISKQRLAELIVQTLRSLGGSAPAPAVLQQMNDRYIEEFEPSDLELLSQDRPRWRQRAKAARTDLVREGVLEDTPGVWTLAQH